MTDDNKSIELTRRRALGSIAIVGAAGAGLGAGTGAYFSDSVESQDNTIEAGDIDLRTNGNNAATTTIDVGPVAPGESGSSSLQVSNVG